MGACNPSYSGGWGTRITWPQEVEVVVSQECATPLQPERQRGSLSHKNKKLKKKIKKKICSEIGETRDCDHKRFIGWGTSHVFRACRLCLLPVSFTGEWAFVRTSVGFSLHVPLWLPTDPAGWDLWENRHLAVGASFSAGLGIAVKVEEGYFGRVWSRCFYSVFLG